MTRKRVYISGPITKPDSQFGRNWNLFQSNVAMTELLLSGWAVMNPMLSMGNHDEIDWETYLQSDESWLSCAHLCLRLPGASMGAERECAFARSRRIPVVGVAYFFHACPTLKELFPDEQRITYTREDELNLQRYNRVERRAAGLPAWDENDPRLLSDIREGFQRVS